MDIFMELKHFTRNEAWGDPDKVNGALLMVMDALRTHLDQGIVIHNAYAQSGHSPKSYHYKGDAVDFHVTELPFAEAVTKVLAFLKDFGLEAHVGLGIYPDWHTPGFHLDLRGSKTRWVRVAGGVPLWGRVSPGVHCYQSCSLGDLMSYMPHDPKIDVLFYLMSITLLVLMLHLFLLNIG